MKANGGLVSQRCSGDLKVGSCISDWFSRKKSEDRERDYKKRRRRSKTKFPRRRVCAKPKEKLPFVPKVSAEKQTCQFSFFLLSQPSQSETD